MPLRPGGWRGLHFRFFGQGARELFDSPLSNTFYKPLQEGLRKAESAETDAAADVTPWRAMAEAVVRGCPRDAMIQHHAQLQQLSSTWRRGLLAVNAHPAVTGHMTGRSYCTPRPLHFRGSSSDSRGPSGAKCSSQPGWMPGHLQVTP